MQRQVDAMVIGGGPGGYVSAIRFSQLGKDVVLVERGALGGACLNRGCVPTKALLHVGKVLNDLRRSERMGIACSALSVDFQKEQKWNHSVVDRVRRGVEYLCKSNGINVIYGAAKFDSPHAVMVEPKGDRITAKTVVIATGSSPLDLPVLRIDSDRILSSDDIFMMDSLPADMLIVGGGAIGVEMATGFASLGTKITLVEIMDQILPGLDTELVAPVSSSLLKLGVDIRLGTKVVGSSLTNDGKVELTLDGGAKLGAERILVAVGRRPNTEGMNLESAGIATDSRGFVKVNDRLETTSRGVFAVGDVIGLPFLAHKAMEQGSCAAEIASGLRDAYPNHPIPSVVYSDPEIATVGLGEKEALKLGYEVLIGKFPFAASARAQTIGRIEGFVKLVSDKSGGVLLGAQIVGQNASELICECSTLIAGSYTLEDIANGVHPHPTLSESVAEAAKMALGRPVHIADP